MPRSRGALFAMILLGGLGTWVPAADATTITTANIASQTVSAASSCLRWRLAGTCFWLRCGFFGCRVRTSLMVAHDQPDLVVGVAPGPGQTPWLEMRNLYSATADTGARALVGSLSGLPSGLALGGGDRVEGRVARDHSALRFKEADAAGHPSPLAFLGLAGAGFGIICPALTQPLRPYFHSGLDALAWRWSVPEMVYPQALTPGVREIGQFPRWTWGSVYPRHGSITQPDDAKAAAVIAQRVGDIVTRSGQPHVYTQIPTGGVVTQQGFRIWRPPELREGQGNTGRWQMLAPQATSSCEVFGGNDLNSSHSWGAGRTSENRAYAFALWRPYRCCARQGWFLGSVQF